MRYETEQKRKKNAEILHLCTDVMGQWWNYMEYKYNPKRLALNI